MEAKKLYNRIMNDMCLEYLTIGTNLSEGTENWNLRDMVCECKYQLECHYEDGNTNSDGMTVAHYMDMYGGDIEDAKYVHSMWLSEVRKLSNFINKYKAETAKMAPTQGHASSLG